MTGREAEMRAAVYERQQGLTCDDADLLFIELDAVRAKVTALRDEKQWLAGLVSAWVDFWDRIPFPLLSDVLGGLRLQQISRDALLYREAAGPHRRPGEATDA